MGFSFNMDIELVPASALRAGDTIFMDDGNFYSCKGVDQTDLEADQLRILLRGRQPLVTNNCHMPLMRRIVLSNGSDDNGSDDNGSDCVEE